MNRITKSLIPALSLALVFSVSPLSQAHAEDLSVGVKTETSLHTQTETPDRELSDRNESVHASTSTKVDSEQEINDTEDSNSAEDDGELDVESHDKAIKTLVHSLTALAKHEEDKKMAKDEKDIAEEQDNELSSTTEAINNVDERGKLLTFLIGADFKNLGAIRSTIAITDSHITELEALKLKDTSVADRAILDSQIKVLQDQKLQMEAYVTAHESTFSLFGWFFKLFQ